MVVRDKTMDKASKEECFLKVRVHNQFSLGGPDEIKNNMQAMTNTYSGLECLVSFQNMQYNLLHARSCLHLEVCI